MFLDKLPKPFFVLAPMDDVTDTVFRQIIDDLSPPDLYFTEFVNVDGLMSPGRPRLIHKLKHTSKDKPLIAQLWGRNPENFRAITGELKDMGFDGVDLNFGCPVKTVIKNGCCSALINDRDHALDIINATIEGAKGEIPVSVKTRLGFSEIDLSWHELLLKQNLSMLSIHGRTAKQLSKAPVDWDSIGEIVKLRDEISTDTLIVGNGDIQSRSHGEQLAKKYSLDGVMIGRSIFNDPFIFSKESPWGQWTKKQKMDLYKRHIELFASTWKPGERRLPTLNKFCKIYINGFDGAKEKRDILMNASTIEELIYLL